MGWGSDLWRGAKNIGGAGLGMATGGMFGNEDFGFIDDIVGFTGGDVIEGIGDYFSAPKDAADEQKKAAKKAQETQTRSLSDALGYMSPYEQRGRQAFTSLADDVQGGKYNMDPSSFKYRDMEMPGQYEEKQFNFETDPGYKFRMKEGEKAIQRSAAAKGGLFSGGTMKDLARYGQGMASDEYSRARGRFERDRQFGYGQNVDQYNRALGERGFQYGAATDDYNRRGTAMANQYNRAAGMANIGTNFAGMMANTQMQGGTNIANAQLGKGNADAARAMAWRNSIDPWINTGLQIVGTVAGVPTGGGGGVGAGGGGMTSMPTGTQYGQSGFPKQMPLQYSGNLNY